MMKKWLKSLTVMAAVALVLIPCVLFSACNDKTTDNNTNNNNNNDNNTVVTSDHTPAVGDVYDYNTEIEWNEIGNAMTDEQKAVYTKSMKMAFVSKDQVKLIIDGQSLYSDYDIVDGKVTIKNMGMVMTIKGETFFMQSELKNEQNEVIGTAVVKCTLVETGYVDKIEDHTPVVGDVYTSEAKFMANPDFTDEMWEEVGKTKEEAEKMLPEMLNDIEVVSDTEVSMGKEHPTSMTYVMADGKITINMPEGYGELVLTINGNTLVGEYVVPAPNTELPSMGTLSVTYTLSK